MASSKNIGDGPGGGRVRILMQDEYNRHAWSFFSHHRGSSWHGKDAKLIFWMGGHWIQITIAGFTIAGVLGAGLWWLYGRLLQLGQRRGQISAKRLWLQTRLWGIQSPKEYELLHRHEV